MTAMTYTVRHSSDVALLTTTMTKLIANIVFRATDALVAGLLLYASWTKILSPGASAIAIDSVLPWTSGTGSHIALILLCLLIAVEGVLAAALIASDRHRLIRGLTGALFVLFSGFVILKALIGTGPTCGCFGAASVAAGSESLLWPLLRNGTVSTVMFAGAWLRLDSCNR
ncbi:MAG: hypothetical protein EBZ75_15880 [Oxalobacteraceae bacterium]|nr:hypothetical protein [Oxalobacteraceae bacterium]